MSGSPGYGGSFYGGFAFAGPSPAALQLLTALAVRENVVQLGFSLVPLVTNLGDVHDGANPAFFTVVPSPGAADENGAPARAVTVVRSEVAPATAPGAAPQVGDVPPGAVEGYFLNLSLDRPLSSFPAAYVVSVVGPLVSTPAGYPVDPSCASLELLGVYRPYVTPQVEVGHPARDVANPQTLSALQSALVQNPLQQASLGAFVVDDSGDYAFDEGLVALKKRIFRRLVTVPGAFAHLGPGYGVGLLAEGKRLGSAATLARIASQAEAQIGQEPEVAKVRVGVTSANDGLVRVSVLVRTRSGLPAKFEGTFPVK